MPDRYITEILLENIMSHKKSLIGLAPPGQITCLTAPSDTGKSAALKGIELLFTGKWDKNLMRYGAKHSLVSCKYSDGHVLTFRIPRNGSATYIIKFPDGHVQTFEAFGRTGTPDEVIALTGVQPITLGDFTFLLNVQRQDSGYFLGNTVSAPGRARILGALAGTEEIDLAARMLSGQLLRDRQEQKKLAGDPEKHTVGEIGELDEKIGEFDYLESLGQTIGEVESLLSQVRQDTELKNKLHKIDIKIIGTNNRIILATAEIGELSEIIDQTTPLLQILDQQTTLHENLLTRFARLTGIQNDLLVQEEILQSTSQLSEVTKILQDTETSNVKRTELINLLAKLNQVRASIEESEKILSTTSHVQEAIALNYISDRDNQTKAQLAKINDAYIQTVKALDEAGRVIALTKTVGAAESILRSLGEDLVKVGRLISLSGQYGQIRHDIRVCEGAMENTSNIKEAENLVFESQKGMDLLAVFFGLQMQRDKVAEAMEAVRLTIEATEGQVAEHEGKRDALYAEMGVCELCGSEVTEEGLMRVI